MNWLEQLFQFIIDPRPRLKSLPSAVSNDEGSGEAPGGRRRTIRPKDLLLNFPLILGALIVLGLFVLVLFGPVWAPQNPYITGRHIVPHYDSESDQFIRPPLPPSPEFPLGTNRWGTDLLSMLMHGARNTLIAAVFITLSRVVLGVIIGAAAGWNEGKTIDRVAMGLIGVTTSIPMLISSTILIYALDIRRGLPVFLAALTIIGWTEIAQYVRSEFLVLRKMPFIEGAYAVGSNELAIAIRHCLPNILPQLLVITFLEMGAVLMLLGELGFIGVFIGGGHTIALFELMAPTQYFTITEVPEWGAMLAEGYRWLRSKPFVVLPPAAAMFISIIGFNSLGEGFRQLIEKHSVNTSFLLRKRTLLILVGILAGSALIISNTGPSPWYARVSESFDSAAAYQHIELLTSMEGRGITQPGGEDAAAYIEGKFEEYGLQPGWEDQSYRYLIPARRVELKEQPELNLVDQGGEIIQAFRHQLDFGFLVEGHGGSGTVSLPVTYIGFPGEPPSDWEAFSGLDLRGRIALLERENAPVDFASEALLHGAEGVIWIAGDGRDDIRSQYTWVDFEMDYLQTPTIPIFRIRSETADRILEEANTNLEAISSGDVSATDSGEGWYSLDLPVSLQMSLDLSSPEAVEIPSVMGYRSGYDLGLAGDMLIVFTTYDGLGKDPDGRVYPGANHNASGVGIMLEIARLWNDQELDPRRSILFVAWPGGLERDLARDLFGSWTNFSHLVTTNPYENVSPEMIVQLDYAGAGGETLLVHPRSTPRLAELVIETGNLHGLTVESRIDREDFSQDIISSGAEWISIRWEDAPQSPLDDDLAGIDPQKIESLGRTLTLTLVNLVREVDY